MLKLVLAGLLGLATTAQADALLQQYEAASVTLETEIFRLSGHSPANAATYAKWDSQRRAASTCALRELETLRGRNTATKYVREYTAAAQKARSARRSSDIGGYIGRAHGRAGLDMNLLVKITQKCGLGL